MKFSTGLLRAIASSVGISNKKADAGTEKVSAVGPASDSLKTELHRRIEEFLERDLFFLVVQPVVAFRDDTVTTGEVLSRLNHPERGIIFPDEFLPVVEDLGLYPKFDRYIFRKSCAWLNRALTAGERVDCISVNFSRCTLSEEHLAAELIAIADRYGVPHGTLAVEITEQIAENGVACLLDNLNRLKAAGFRIILDDFGSGVTSFNDLMRYPLDIVKIDRSLLLEAESEKGGMAYRALVSMAKELGTIVVCEGIETEVQNRFAREAGCHYGQGFLFFQPIAQERVLGRMRKSSILEEDV